jgi:hypothetical protein
MRCGSFDIEELRFSNSVSEPFRHSCGEHLFIVPTDPDAPWFAFNDEKIELDAEGLVLTSSDSRPSSEAVIDLNERLTLVHRAHRLLTISSLLSSLCFTGVLVTAIWITQLVYSRYGLAWSLLPPVVTLLGFRFGVELLLTVAVTFLTFHFHEMTVAVSCIFYAAAAASARLTSYIKGKQAQA